MGKHPEKALSPAFVRNVSEPGMYADGNCLYLVVEESGSKHWIVRTMINGKRCDVGAGGLAYISLADARDRAGDIRKAARDGKDPLEEKREMKRQANRESTMPVFETAAREYHAELSKALTNEKHKRNWIESLEKFVFPAIGKQRVNMITTADILKILSPIWLKVPERAKRTKQRIGAVMQWAKAKEYVSGDNPVEGIEKVLPKVQREQEHYAALPFGDVPAFVRSLRTDAGISGRLAFEFLILTAARTSEVIKATWTEIDFENAMWTRPKEHMKAKREHRVPLSLRCIEILREAKKITDGGKYIFPGMRSRQPLSNMVFHATLRRMDKSGFTPHGFRSAFRDWSEDKTSHKRHTIETALAHIVRDKVERSYLRTVLPKQHRELMEMWARFVTSAPAAKVVKMRG